MRPPAPECAVISSNLIRSVNLKLADSCEVQSSLPVYNLASSPGTSMKYQVPGYFALVEPLCLGTLYSSALSQRARRLKVLYLFIIDARSTHCFLHRVRSRMEGLECLH